MSTQIPQVLKGFRDFLPEDARKRLWLMGVMRKVYELHGFVPLETPTLEYKETIMGKYGNEADKLVYQFVDNGDREVALRYDQTVPTSRVIAQYHQQLPMPFRRYQMQNVFRADKPQKGRYREFTQSDADIFGSSYVGADAEILSVFYDIYCSSGLQNFKILVNDRESLHQLILRANIADKDFHTVLQSLDKLDKFPQETVEQELYAKGFSKEQVEQVFASIHVALPSAQLQAILDSAESLGVPKECCVFSPTLVRGLDYYTGLIFECSLGAGGSLGGGGRYDHLIQQLAGVEMAAVGFGIGFDRTLEALDELGLIPSSIQSSAEVLVTVFDPSLAQASAALTQQLRHLGLAAELYPTFTDKLAKQLKYASKKNVSCVIILGSDEIAKKQFTLKNMDSGEQVTLSAVEEVATYLSKGK